MPWKRASSAAWGVIAYDSGNLPMQLTVLMPVQKIGQTVQLLRDENGHPRRCLRQFEAPPHVEFSREILELRFEGREVEILEPPLDPHEKELRFVILMLVGVDDVRAAFVEQHRDAGDEALPIRAVD